MLINEYQGPGKLKKQFQTEKTFYWCPKTVVPSQKMFISHLQGYGFWNYRIHKIFKKGDLWPLKLIIFSRCTYDISLKLRHYVTLFSSYYIHKLRCPRHLPAWWGDDNTPSAFYGQWVETFETKVKLNKIIMRKIASENLYLFSLQKSTRIIHLIYLTLYFSPGWLTTCSGLYPCQWSSPHIRGANVL